MSIQVDLKTFKWVCTKWGDGRNCSRVKTAHHMLHNGTGMGNDYIGWLAFCQQIMIKKNLRGFRKRQNKFNLIRIF